MFSLKQPHTTCFLIGERALISAIFRFVIAQPALIHRLAMSATVLERAELGPT
jgi:hypothetical protein